MAAGFSWTAAPGPLTTALAAKDPSGLAPVLAALLKAELGPIRLEQTSGERFTGGKSTPVWKLFFTATRGDRTRSTQLVAKWVQPSTDFRRSSYVNERQFYTNAAAAARKSCRLPHLLLSEVSSEGLCFLFDDLSVDFPLHPECLDTRGAEAALLWLARFHACFWEADAAGGSFPAGTGASAGYWGLGHGDNDARLEGVARSLVSCSKVLQAHGAWERAKTLGPRLTAAARPLDAALRGAKGARGFQKHRTLLHGDFKTANMFLREGGKGGYEVAAVDFEFAGPGLVAADLANFLFPDLRMNLLPEEPGLLRFYHASLEACLEELGLGCDLTLPLLEAHYAAARCDYMRYMLGKGWTACGVADAQLLLAVDRDLSRLDGGELLAPERYERALSEAFKG